MRQLKLTALAFLTLSIVFTIGCTKKKPIATKNTTEVKIIPVPVTVTADVLGEDGKPKRVNVDAGTKFNVTYENGENSTSELPPINVKKGEVVPYPGYEVSDDFPNGNPLKPYESKVFFVGYHKKVVSTKVGENGVFYEGINFDEFDFDAVAKEDTSIVALFVQPKKEGNVIISFRTKHNKAPKYFEADPNDKIKQPPHLYSTKTKPRLIFKGWQKSNCDINSASEKTKDLPCAWDFTKTINENKSSTGKNGFPIIAVWEEVPETNLIVSFHPVETPIGVVAPLPLSISKFAKIQAPVDFVTRADANASNPATASEEGKVFVRWYKYIEQDKNAYQTPFNFDNGIIEDTKIYGFWEAENIKLKLVNLKKPAENKSLDVAYGFTYDRIKTELDKHTFTNPQGNDLKLLGWKIKGTSELIDLNSTTSALKFNTELEAVWQEARYNVTFKAGETSVNHLAGGAQVTVIDESSTDLTMPENVTKIAYGTLIKNINSLVNTNGNLSEATFTAQAANASLYKGFRFTGWKIKGAASGADMLVSNSLAIQDFHTIKSTETADKKFVDKDIVLTATWQPVEQDKVVLKFVHPQNLSIAPTTKSLPIDTVLNKTTHAPAASSLTSKYSDFSDQWYKDAGYTIPFDWGNQITEDTTLYAKWTPKTFAISWVYEYKENITRVVNGKVVLDRQETKTANLAGSLGFAASEDPSLPTNIVYGKTLPLPEVKNPLPNHKLRWSVAKTNDGQELTNFQFGQTLVGENIKVTLIDEGFSNSAILDTMVRVLPPNKTYIANVRFPWKNYTFNIGVTKEFYIAKFEVSQELYSRQIDETKRYKPQAGMTVNKANALVARLNRELASELRNWRGDGKNWKFAIPHENQWRWASFGGRNNEFTGPINDKNFPGAKGSSLNSNENSKSLITNYAVVARSALTGQNADSLKVGTKLPNELGLYDMAGNISEIVINRSGNYRRYGGDFELVDQVGLFNRIKPWSLHEPFPDEGVSSINTGTTGLRLVLVQAN